MEKKGFDTLIRAWPAVIRALPDATLRIVGDGPCDAKLRGLARKCGAGDKISFSGALPENETLRAIADSDVLVLPSRRLPNGDRDGIANVILEALALGVPVVTTDAGAAGEVVVDGVAGRLLPSPATPDALAEAIVGLANEKPEVAENGFPVVRDFQRFSVEAYLEAVVALLTTQT